MDEHSVKKHYENLLADNYSWMFRSFKQQVKKNRSWFKKHDIYPRSNAKAIDFGCGSGFQSLALSSLDFDVTGVDFNRQLLEELKSHDQHGTIKTIQCNFLEPEHYASKTPFELAICMGDTLAHLSSEQSVSNFFRIVYGLLESGGKLILSFRDYAEEATGIDRFIPVRQEQDKIMTVFLEYKPNYILVHDLIYERNENAWELKKSAYKKIRLTTDKVKLLLKKANFSSNNLQPARGMVHIIATK